ncbi:MAG: hypothetical protein PHY74_03775 [Candidatus Bathyarchaeota archaeon]|nr:hypothetical protein [Candidatus Bathyarchaeota archaeon]MDD4326320.1 hypothetical protein [Candidatus Bathyarchaeota archaeon]MDT8782947.1 hypothetical protein [Candidatus Bathyarchaeota archaeon]
MYFAVKNLYNVHPKILRVQLETYNTNLQKLFDTAIDGKLVKIDDDIQRGDVNAGKVESQVNCIS